MKEKTFYWFQVGLAIAQLLVMFLFFSLASYLVDLLFPLFPWLDIFLRLLIILCPIIGGGIIAGMVASRLVFQGVVGRHYIIARAVLWQELGFSMLFGLMALGDAISHQQLFLDVEYTFLWVTAVVFLVPIVIVQLKLRRLRKVVVEHKS